MAMWLLESGRVILCDRDVCADMMIRGWVLKESDKTSDGLQVVLFGRLRSGC